MANQHGDFIWYELMTPDPAASQAFYEGLLHWKFSTADAQNGGYREFSMDGTPVGGLLPLSDTMQEGGARPLWAGYIGVNDVDACANTLLGLGGHVVMPARDIPDVGRFAFVRDPQGAHFYIMRGFSNHSSESFATHVPRVGHCAWNELATSDPAAAGAFYADLFGWVTSERLDMGPMGDYDILKNGAERDFSFGAVMASPDEVPVSQWSYYFRVPSIDAAVLYIDKHGGQVVHGPMEIPGGDVSLSAIDPQGAFVALVGKA